LTIEKYRYVWSQVADGKIYLLPCGLIKVKYK